MSHELTNALVTIAVAIIGVATLAVIVSRNANTSGVIKSAGGALAQDLSAAVSPVTGGSFGFSSPDFGNFGF